LEAKLNLDPDSNPDPELVTVPDPNLQIISDPAGSGSGCTTLIADIAAEVENECQVSVMKLAQAHYVSAKMVHATLHKNLPLSRSQPGE
jgi:hypothetical protein